MPVLKSGDLMINIASQQVTLTSKNPHYETISKDFDAIYGEAKFESIYDSLTKEPDFKLIWVATCSREQWEKMR